MGAVLGADGAGTVLPVTGSGPFSMLLALIGSVSVLFGAIARRFGHRPPVGPCLAESSGIRSSEVGLR